jgi:hypothetical protein
VTGSEPDPTHSGPTVGGYYLLAESDYRFGVGELLARVTRVHGPVEFGEGGRCELWWQVDAVCTVPRRTGPGQHRSLYVRADCLPTARRHPRGR